MTPLLLAAGRAEAEPVRGTSQRTLQVTRATTVDMLWDNRVAGPPFDSLGTVFTFGCPRGLSLFLLAVP